MNPLLALTCRPLAGAPLTEDELRSHLPHVSEWRVSQGALERTFAFDDYHRTIAFVNALAWIAHTQDHHPELAVSYNRCVVRWRTHSVNGVSLNDFICAARADALLR